MTNDPAKPSDSSESPLEADLPTNVRAAGALPVASQRATDPGALGAAATRKAHQDDAEEELEDAEEIQSSPSDRRVSLAALISVAPVGRFGRYDLLGRIAYGGMAEIFLAREVQDGRPGRFVVVKRVLPHVARDKQFVDMFIDEARLVMQLAHPNICHVYAYGTEQGVAFIAMEWVNGFPLSRVFRRARTDGGLSIGACLKITAQVAEALDHAHRAVDQSTGEPLGIVHRDVSPQNVMLSFEGVVKLLDFGVAKASSHSTKTEAGTIKGKFAYMAPEQCIGEPLDARADVFALGIVLHELLIGRNPYKRATEFDTMRAIVYEDMPLPSAVRPDVGAAIDAVVRRATAKKPEERYHSAADFQTALEETLSRRGDVVTTARIGERMHELFSSEIKAGPRLDTRLEVPKTPPPDGASEVDVPRVPPPPGATEKVQTLSTDAARAALGEAASLAVAHGEAGSAPAQVIGSERRGPGWVALALAAVVLLATGAGGAYLLATQGASIAAAPPVVAPRVEPVVGGAAVGVPLAPSTGTLFVDSTPGGAAISLGVRGRVGTTPMELALLEAGEWTVRLHLDGYEDWDDTIELHAGERVRILGELEPLPSAPVATGRPRPPRVGGEEPRGTSDTPPSPPAAAAAGRLSLNTRPWSRVYAGSRLLGTTPLGDVEVDAGTLRLRLVDRDGNEHTRSVTVPAGGVAREFFDLSEGAVAPAPE